MEYYYDSVTKIDADEILKSLTLLACNPGGLEAVGAATLLALKSIAGGGVIPLQDVYSMDEQIALLLEDESKRPDEGWTAKSLSAELRIS